jgi:hypothetical protein
MQSNHLFARIQFGDGDLISVTRRDGTVVMRTPFALDLVGRTMSTFPGALRAVANERCGSPARASSTG